MRKFANLLESEGVWVVGTDVFLGGVEPDKPDACYWIVSNGGDASRRAITGESKAIYNLVINYRDSNERNVYNNLSALEDSIKILDCPTLDGIGDVDIRVTTPTTDNDRDFEDRSLGSLQVTIEII